MRYLNAKLSGSGDSYAIPYARLGLNRLIILTAFQTRKWELALGYRRDDYHVQVARGSV